MKLLQGQLIVAGHGEERGLKNSSWKCLSRHRLDCRIRNVMIYRERARDPRRWPAGGNSGLDAKWIAGTVYFLF